MRVLLEKRAEASTLMAICSPFIALGLTVIAGGIIFALRGFNPVEALWGNVKGQECANLCAPDRPGLVRPLHRGLRRVRGRPHLAFSFLAHAGLSL